MKKIFLVMFLVVGINLFAGEWVPYIDTKEGKIDSAVLAPNGKSFYTLKDGTITHWQLNPVKLLESFRINIKPTHERFIGIKMFLDRAENRMLLWTQEEILLLDLKKKEILNNITVSTVGLVQIGGKIFTINKSNEIVQRDFRTLKILDTKKIKLDCENSQCLKSIQYLVGRENYLYYGGDGFFVQISAKNLEKIKQFSISTTTALSYNHREMYFRNKCELPYGCKYKISLNNGEVTHLLPPEDATNKELHDYTMSSDNSKTTIPVKIANISNVSQYKNIMILRLSHKSNYLKQSILNNYRGMPWGVLDSKKNLFFVLASFKNNQWIFMNSEGFFQMSKNARQYLKMRFKDDQDNLVHDKQVKDISDDVFKKYNKVILIGEK